MSGLNKNIPAGTQNEDDASSQTKTVIVFAFAGNANTGKSTIFNQLTGLVQITGNWTGKTTHVAEGYLHHQGSRIKVVDLPGTYSLSDSTEDGRAVLGYILSEKPDVIINVVDATALERNLYLTLQFLEMQIPFVVALNLSDEAEKRGIYVNAAALERTLGVPVVTTVATKGTGLESLVKRALDAIHIRKDAPYKDAHSILRSPPPDDERCTPEIKYGPEIESAVSKICAELADAKVPLPSRWAALKLLEGDAGVAERVRKTSPSIIETASHLRRKIATIHGGEDPATVIASERYAAAGRIARTSQQIRRPRKKTASKFLAELSTHTVWGYIILMALMSSILLFISIVGGYTSEWIHDIFELIKPPLSTDLQILAWDGAVVGMYAALSVAVGFILPFYIILGILEDSGYLPRLAYLMDRPCHAVGLHGNASMPIMLAFGCNVPACLSCQIMENKRDRFIATVLATMVPCSARTVVILGLVGAYVGWQWAVGIYLLNFVIIFIIGRALNWLMPATSDGMIMEMPAYRTPSAGVVLRQSWFRFKDFVYIALPLIVVGSVAIEGLRIYGYLEAATEWMSPVTVWWLGLPAFTGILFLFGILRKEAALVLLVTLAGTSELTSVLSSLQMVVFTIVLILYVPCISTIAALVRTEGIKNAVLISAAEVMIAFTVGGILYRVLEVFM